MICHYAPRWVLRITGLALVVLAFGAFEFQLDNNPTWGPYRVAFLITGLACLIAAQRIGRHRDLSPAPGIGPRAGQDRRSALAIGVVSAILVELMFIWMISVGYWTSWPPTSGYYDMLAEAFSRGQLDLPIEPDPQLAGLENPYSSDARDGIPYLADATYFNGRYYMYWGPAPAVILAGLKFTGLERVGDEVVVFGAANLVLLFTILIVIQLWFRYSSELPNWVLFLALLVVGLAHPLLWILNRPAIHEAAIASGQAFLLGGLYFALPAFENARASTWRLAAAGSLWALAMSSRTILVVPIGLFVVAVLKYAGVTLRPAAMPRHFRSSLLGLLMPMVVGGSLLALYNFNRFGNVLEFGWRYHLGGRGDYSQGLYRAFNLMFIVPNVYNYLARPVSTLTVFPFIKPIWGRDTLSPLPVELPEPYYVEQVTGALVAVPFLLYSGYLVGWLVCSDAWPGRDPRLNPVEASNRSLVEANFRRVMSIILLGGLAAAAPLALFSIVAARYLLDAVPLFLIASIGGSWIVLSRNFRTRWGRYRGSLVYVFTSLLSVLASFLLAVTGFEARFEHLNPILFDRITRLLAW